MQILKVSDLNVSLNKNLILNDVSFDIEKGDVLAIIGPNGAGKTTLFNALLGLISYTGKIEWKKDIKLGFVPQRIDIDTDMPITVEEFFKFKNRHITNEKIIETLSLVQLNKDILKKGLGEISVGQRQRILIAWSIIDHPDVLLFDEPTADVDVSGQESIYKTLSMLREKFELTVILISHDLNVVYQYANKVLCINHKNLCLGAPIEVLKPETLAELYGGDHGFYQHKHTHK